MTNFDRAFDLIIGVEGGYVNDPNDPGGETKWGICKRDHPTLDIANLTQDQAKDIYQAEYWSKAYCDSLPWPLCLFVFDSAVNQGPSVAVRLLQHAVKVSEDGVIGPASLQAISSQNQKELGCRYLAERAYKYMTTANFDRYGEGWFFRLFTIAMEA